MDIRSLTDNPRRQMGDYIKLPWVFEKFYEKIILVLLVAWSLYALMKILFLGC